MEESDLLIMAHAIRHQVSDVELQDLLNLINAHLPRPLNPSRYMFLKKFPSIAEIQEHYYCPDCEVAIKFENAKSKQCENCMKKYEKKKLKRDENYFIYIPLKQQLIKLLIDRKFFEKLNRNTDNSTSDV